MIIRYGDQDVTGVRQLRDLVANTSPGTRVAIEIIRDGKKETLHATIGSQSRDTSAIPSEIGANPLTKLGLKVETLTPDLANRLGANEQKGVVITGVTEGSLASLAGLQKGDVIVEAEHQAVSSVDELEQVLAKATSKSQVLLRGRRQGGSLFIVLQLKWHFNTAARKLALIMTCPCGQRSWDTGHG